MLQLQKTAVRGLAGNTELCRAGIDDLLDFLQSQGYPEEVRRAQEKKLLLTLAAVAASQPSSVASDVVSDHPVLVAPEVVLATCPAGSEEAPYYIAVVGKKRFRRLHRKALFLATCAR